LSCSDFVRPNSSKHHIRVCTCLTVQFVFFSRYDSAVLLTVIIVQVSEFFDDDPVSLHQNSGIMSLFVRLQNLSSPDCVFQSSSRTTRPTSSTVTYCCEVVDRPEWRFARVDRVRWLTSSISSETISRRPYQQLLGNFDLTSTIQDHSSKVEIQITSCIQRF
jgi:hypothetical protein